MMTFPNTVHVGKNVAYYTDNTSPVGAIGVFDSQRKLTNATDVVNEPFIYIGTQKDGVLEFSAPIYKNFIKSIAADTYVAPNMDTTTIDGSAAVIVPTYEYVIRIVYKDVYEHPGQFTQTYRAIASTNVWSDLAEALVTKINENPNSRVTASLASNVITLVAKERTDTNGLYSINEYDYVNTKVVMWGNAQNSPINENKNMIPGVVITKTINPDAGKGYWKTVRDQEKWAAGYKGIGSPLGWPVTSNSMNWYSLLTEVEQTYNSIVIVNNVPYQSPDNQYEKKTGVTTEIYLPTAATAMTTAILAILNPFIAAANSQVVMNGVISNQITF